MLGKWIRKFLKIKNIDFKVTREGSVNGIKIIGSGDNSFFPEEDTFDF